MITDFELYSVNHVTSLPESLSSYWSKPRQLNDAYVVYRGVDSESPIIYSVPLDEQGQPSKDILTVIYEVASLMYADSLGQIILRRSEALDLLSTPHWRVYCGQYSDKLSLVSDCGEVGIQLTSVQTKTLDQLVIEAKDQLKFALSQ